MAALNKPERYSDIFLRHGQVPLGQNPHAEPSLDEVSLSAAAISDSLSDVLTSDDVLSLGDSHGNPMAGDPATFDFLRITLSLKN